MAILDAITEDEWNDVVTSADIKLHNELRENGIDGYELPMNVQWAAVTGFEGGMEALEELGFMLVRKPVEGATS